MQAVATAENGVLLVRRNTLEWILFGVLGFLAIVVSGWVGRTVMQHEARLDVLEAQAATTQQMCISVERNLTEINQRLGRIESRLMGEGGTTMNGDNGGGS